jgi:hypothetical protein
VQAAEPVSGRRLGFGLASTSTCLPIQDREYALPLESQRGEEAQFCGPGAAYERCKSCILNATLCFLREVGKRSPRRASWAGNLLEVQGFAGGGAVGVENQFDDAKKTTAAPTKKIRGCTRFLFTKAQKGGSWGIGQNQRRCK